MCFLRRGSIDGSATIPSDGTVMYPLKLLGAPVLSLADGERPQAFCELAQGVLELPQALGVEPQALRDRAQGLSASASCTNDKVSAVTAARHSNAQRRARASWRRPRSAVIAVPIKFENPDGAVLRNRRSVLNYIERSTGRQPPAVRCIACRLRRH